MSEFLEAVGLDRAETGDDNLVAFAVEPLDCRGRIVRLGPAIDTLLTSHDYPEPVARLLGQASVLAVLIGSAMKFDGRFVFQTQTDGPVSLMIADFSAPDAIRAYARFDAKAVEDAVKSGAGDAARLLGKGALALTIDQGPGMKNYQGIVELDNTSLEAAALGYFDRSEQIPTSVRLAVGQMQEKGAARPGPVWRAGGILVQHFPPAQKPAGKPADDPEGKPVGDPEDMPAQDNPENWRQASAHVQTVSDLELIDPEISPERLLFRLFHETGVRVFPPRPIVHKCPCSAQKVEAMLSDFSPAQRAEMAVNGEIEVKCDFCSAKYLFNPNRFQAGP
ncbi:MAG: Hsp33 family molecular chaperone [Alphaproteobacteria bacterium]|nr:Hsp33 family molecular chaperone [Alphaproteobacteria bacterium]